MLREWIGIDRLNATAKDTNIYPDFASLKGPMVAETDTFINAVVMSATPTVGELLSREYTPEDPDARRVLLEGVGTSAARAPESGRVPLGLCPRPRERAGPPRRRRAPARGLPRDQVADRAQHQRGAAAARSHEIDARALRHPRDRSGMFSSATTPSTPSASRSRASTRWAAIERRTTTSRSTAASTWRSAPTSTAPTPNSNELAAAMAQAPSVQACFARNLFRSASGRSAGADALATEQEFLKFVKTIDGADTRQHRWRPWSPTFRAPCSLSGGTREAPTSSCLPARGGRGLRGPPVLPPCSRTPYAQAAGETLPLKFISIYHPHGLAAEYWVDEGGRHRDAPSTSPTRTARSSRSTTPRPTARASRTRSWSSRASITCRAPTVTTLPAPS